MGCTGIWLNSSCHPPIVRTERVAVPSESSQIRHDGYVVTRGNRVPDAASMAVPIFSFGNKLEAVMTISGPIGDYTEERVKEYLSVMMVLGQTISKQMGATL